MKNWAWLTPVLLIIACLLLVSVIETRNQELVKCQVSLEEMTNTFNGCLTSYNFVENQLAECRGEAP